MPESSPLPIFLRFQGPSFYYWRSIRRKVLKRGMYREGWIDFWSSSTILRSIIIIHLNRTDEPICDAIFLCASLWHFMILGIWYEHTDTRQEIKTWEGQIIYQTWEDGEQNGVSKSCKRFWFLEDCNPGCGISMLAARDIPAPRISQNEATLQNWKT